MNRVPKMFLFTYEYCQYFECCEYFECYYVFALKLIKWMPENTFEYCEYFE